MVCIAGHKLSPALVIRRGVDTCRGLQELHDIGIVMRDLKPVCSSHVLLLFLFLLCHVLSFHAMWHLGKDLPAQSQPRENFVVMQPNVLIGGSGTAVLADFGLGKAATNIYKSGCGGHMGTMDYTYATSFTLACCLCGVQSCVFDNIMAT